MDVAQIVSYLRLASGSKYLKNIPLWAWILGLVGGLGWYLWWDVTNKYKAFHLDSHEVIASLELRVENYEGCRTESPDGDSPLRVTFSDNRVAYVNFFHVALPANWPPEPTPEWEQWERTAPVFAEYIGNSLRSAILSEFELVTLEYARTHRDQMMQDIIKRLEPIFGSLGFKLHQFDLLEFCEVRVPVLPRQATPS